MQSQHQCEELGEKFLNLHGQTLIISVMNSKATAKAAQAAKAAEAVKAVEAAKTAEAAKGA